MTAEPENSAPDRHAAGQGVGYTALDWARDLAEDKSPIILLTGSAGGGKSRAAGEKVHAFMRTGDTPATGLVMRKAREFASKSIVPFMRYAVMGKDPAVEYKKGDMTFEYTNGGLLYVGGMKDDMQREAIRSIGSDGALDIVWMEEANAFTEDDFNEILGRMRGKARGYTQIILTTNPDAPNHWINRRLIIGGQAKVYYSGALDNPHNPPEYREKLEMMTGTLYERLVLGRWVQAEGAIYDNFTVEHNVTEDAEYNPGETVWWGVDDGYAAGGGPGTEGYHPRVFLLAHITAQGGIHVFAEYYKTNELSEVSIDNVLALPGDRSESGSPEVLRRLAQFVSNPTGQPYAAPELAAVDSSALELKARIWAKGIQTIGATHTVSEGIKNVRRLICDGQGVRLLKIHPRCVNLIREMQSYRYDDHSKVAQIGEPKPLKVDDHGPDALRYLAWKLRYTD